MYLPTWCYLGVVPYDALTSTRDIEDHCCANQAVRQYQPAHIDGRGFPLEGSKRVTKKQEHLYCYANMLIKVPS